MGILARTQRRHEAFLSSAMAPMKAMKGTKKAVKSISKTEIAQGMAVATDLKKSDCSKMLAALANIAGSQVKKTGKIIIPGIAMLKTRVKPATKAGKMEIFGKMVVVKARAAKTVVKAFPVAALKKVL